MMEIPEGLINWCGKLLELGAKAKFTPTFDISDQTSHHNGPLFVCTCQVSEYSVKVEQQARNKKNAKQAAAQEAYGQLMEKINEEPTSSLDVIISKLSQLRVNDDDFPYKINCYRKFDKLQELFPKVNGGGTNGDAEESPESALQKILDNLECTKVVRKSTENQDNSDEYQCIIEIYPREKSTLVVTGFGLSGSSQEEAEIKATQQVIEIIKIMAR